MSIKLDKATALHREGNLSAAINAYADILSVEPHNFTALHMRGLAHAQQGQLAEGLNYMEAARLIRPESAVLLVNMGNVLRQLGRLTEALVCFEKALDLKSDFAEALSSIAALLVDLGRDAEALLAVDKALKLKPSLPDALNNRANMLRKLGRVDEAIESYESALRLGRKSAPILNNYGLALKDSGNFALALQSYEEAICIEPDYAEALNNKGMLLHQLDRSDEAWDCYDRAIGCRKNFAEAFNNKGILLHDLNRLEDAINSYDMALAIRPVYAEAWCNRGIALVDLGRPKEARASYDQALSIDPKYVEANWNKSLLLLMLGEYSEGWLLYEWRLQREASKSAYQKYQKPLWRGESMVGKTLLVQAEQGFGDMVQFCRYLPLLSKTGANIVVEVPDGLRELISTLGAEFTILKNGDALPVFDAYCPLMSLPSFFGTTLGSVPNALPYLYADRIKVAKFKTLLGASNLPRVGFVWSGSIDHKNDKKRSVSFSDIVSLLDVPVEWHALQKYFRPEELSLIEKSSIKRHDHELSDFSDTAALIECMDLVISVDTSVAHVAGALNKPVWIMLPYVPDFRWLLERDDSPWYSSARLFRQAQIGDWGGVINRVRRALRERLSVREVSGLGKEPASPL